MLGPQRRCAKGCTIADEEDGRGVEAGGVAVRRQGSEDDAAREGGGGGGFKDWKGLGNEGRVVKGCCRVWRGFPGPDYRLRVPEHCAVLCLPPEADTVNVFLSIVTSPPSIGRQVNARPVLSYGPLMGRSINGYVED